MYFYYVAHNQKSKPIETFHPSPSSHEKPLTLYTFLCPKTKYSNINLEETRRGERERDEGCGKGRKLSSQGILFHVKSLCVFKS
jgi:hypothetical protein